MQKYDLQTVEMKSFGQVREKFEIKACDS